MATTDMVLTETEAMPRRAMRRRAALIVSSLALIPAVHAETFTYGIDAGLGETDNVTLAHTDKLSQTMAVTDADFDYLEQSPRLNVDAKGDFTYIDYLQNAYSHELLGRFDGDAKLALIPQRLTWVLQDDFGKMAIDPFTPVTPTNLQNINYISTGPDLALRFGGLTFLNLSARVSRVQYESSPFSSNQAHASVAWGWQLSALSSVSLIGDTERFLFENTAVNTDFDRSNVFVRYELEGARTMLSTDLGVTTVEADGKSTQGGLAKASLSRRLSKSARLTLEFGRELTDGTSAFSGLQSGALGVIATAPAAGTSQNYTTDYASLGWQYERNRTTVALSGRWEKDLYDGDQAQDHTLRTAEFRVQRQLTTGLTAQLLGRLYKSDYDHVSPGLIGGSPSNDTQSIVAGLVWRRGRWLELKLQCEHTTYTTAPTDTGYRENRVYLKVGYRPVRNQPGEAITPDI